MERNDMEDNISSHDKDSFLNLQPIISEFKSNLQDNIKLTPYYTKPKSKQSDGSLNVKSSQKNSTISMWDENFTFVIPFLNIFRWFLLAPWEIQFDDRQGQFIAKNARPLIKIISYIWLLSLSSYVIYFMLNELNPPYTVEVITGKLSWACYAIYDFTAIACLRKNGDEIAKLLTEGSEIFQLLEQLLNKQGNKKNYNRGKYMIRLVSGLTLTYTTFFVIFVTTEFTASTTNLYSLFLNLTSDGNDSGESGDTCTSERQVLCNLILRFASCFYASVLLILWFLVAFSIELFWLAFLLMVAAFGCYFNNMFLDCTQAIENGHVDLLHGMRIYTKITLLLEEFNKIFGHAMLWIVIASILWFPSATLGEFLAGFSNGLLFGIVNISACVPFIITLYTASELHNTGYILPSVLKRRFLHTDFMKKNEQTLQMGVSLVQFDTLSNNIGIKGAGFFTISYAFVGSMVGIIITYSIVTVQFTMK